MFAGDTTVTYINELEDKLQSLRLHVISQEKLLNSLMEYLKLEQVTLPEKMVLRKKQKKV